MIKIAICNNNLKELIEQKALIGRFAQNEDCLFDIYKYTSESLFLSETAQHLFDIAVVNLPVRDLNQHQLISTLEEFPDTSAIFLSEPDCDTSDIDAAVLTKPYSEKDLFALLNQAVVSHEHKNNILYLKRREAVIELPYAEIEFLEIKRELLYFHKTNGDELMLRGKLKLHENKLLCRHEFVRVNKTVIVNLDHIYEINKSYLITKTQKRIYIEESMYGNLSSRYTAYLSAALQ